MNAPRSFVRRSAIRGSALLSVMIFALVLLILSGSVIQWSVTERRLNARAGAWLEARNAAEAVAEYGCFQVAQGFNSRMSPTFSSSGTNPVSLPTSVAQTFFSGSNVDLSSLSVTASSPTQVPSTGLYYINPNDPNNSYDPMVGRYCYRRDVTILSKATVNPPSGTGGPITAYIKEKVSVRGAPLFAYAIFYSANDLEFNETPKMDIYGPVHVNGNLFVLPAGSSPQPLTFHGPVTASGNVYHAWRGTTTTAQEDGASASATTAVNFSTDSTVDGNPANMRTSSGTWNDSTMGASNSPSRTDGLANLQALVTPARTTQFAQYSSQTWHGNLQTAAMGIQSYNPMGFNEIVAVNSGTNILGTDPAADNNAVVGTNGTYGAGYGHGYGPRALIEPAMALPDSSDPYAVAKTSIEQGKFARKAGLYVKVDITPGTTDTANITLYGDPNSAPAGTPSSNIGPNGGIKLGPAPANVIQFIPYATTGSGNSTVVTTGMYDRHQSSGYNLVQVNMAALKTALTDMTTASPATAGTDIVQADNTTKWGIGTANTGYDQYTPGATGWNGGIYIEVNPSGSTKQTGVILANGQVSSGNTLVPTGSSAPNGVTGLTIATNAPAYILGNYNADGSISTSNTTNSALYPDDTASGTPVASSVESPVALAADAVTVLSANFFGTNSSTHLAPYPGGTVSTNPSGSSARSTYTTAAPSASGSVEIATAIISGTTMTSSDSLGTQNYSGGVHNFPRFLENWGSNTVAIRGSIVCMYLSRIATADWNQAYYSAPVRQWGYDQIFANGKFPPICPTVLSFRRVDFTYLPNAAAYNTELSHL